MKVKKALFIGGTGIISTGSSALVLEKGWELTLLNRRQHANANPLLKNARVIQADINDEQAVIKALGNETFDVVIQWVAFTPDQIERDIRLFRDRCKQYVFISSATVYERPSRHYPITESTPLNNRFSEYGRNKQHCEERLLEAYRQEGFPATIVRPSLTYGVTQIPMATGSWLQPWSFVQRILDGKEVVVHGDGTGLWTITHNTDFAKGIFGLMGRSQAIGEAYHITSDEVLTWDAIAIAIGKAVGETPKIVHATSEQISRFLPGQYGSLVGDKATSAVMDNSKIKRLVPDFVCTVPFEEGVRWSVEYFQAHPELQTIDQAWNTAIDAIIEADKKFRP